MRSATSRTLSDIAEQLDRLSKELPGLDAAARHDVGNALAIVRACHEGIIDGVLEPSAQRLRSMAASLEKARTRLGRAQ